MLQKNHITYSLAIFEIVVQLFQHLNYCTHNFFKNKETFLNKEPYL